MRGGEVVLAPLYAGNTDLGISVQKKEIILNKVLDEIV
jgi:hypothetical protein